MSKEFSTKAELIRMALIYAIQDRESYRDADPGEHGDTAYREAREFRAYLKTRFGEPINFEDK